MQMFGPRKSVIGSSKDTFFNMIARYQYWHLACSWQHKPMLSSIGGVWVPFERAWDLWEWQEWSSVTRDLWGTCRSGGVKLSGGLFPPEVAAGIYWVESLLLRNPRMGFLEKVTRSSIDTLVRGKVLDSQWTVPLSKAVIMHTETCFFSFPPCAFFWIHFVVITVVLLLAPVAFYPPTMHLSCRLDCFLFYSSLLKLWILN